MVINFNGTFWFISSFRHLVRSVLAFAHLFSTNLVNQRDVFVNGKAAVTVFVERFEELLRAEWVTILWPAVAVEHPGELAYFKAAGAIEIVLLE